jgi:hypothetical protein
MPVQELHGPLLCQPGGVGVVGVGAVVLEEPVAGAGIDVEGVFRTSSRICPRTIPDPIGTAADLSGGERQRLSLSRQRHHAVRL